MDTVRRRYGTYNYRGRVTRRRAYPSYAEVPLGRKITKQIVACVGIGLTCFIIEGIQLPAAQVISDTVRYALTYTVDYEQTLESIHSMYLEMSGQGESTQTDGENSGVINNSVQEGESVINGDTPNEGAEQGENILEIDAGNEPQKEVGPVDGYI